MKSSALKISKINIEKMKCDDLYDKIMDFKQVRGVLPQCLMLDADRIPRECRATMSLTIDDTIIPIIELSEHPC